MNLFKRFVSDPEPTEQDLADALAFKNKLKYGEDINARYKDACAKSTAAYKEKDAVKDNLAEIFKFKKRKTYENWTSFNISLFAGCTKSPIEHCLYISYYGDQSPEKDDPTYCICCEKKLF
jgi:hypothetical protein